jgi:hypothetical protein
MRIRQTLEVVNAMERAGVIGRYAIGGAVAAYNYVEPAVTEDLDIFVSFETRSSSKLISLDPVLHFLRQRGYSEFRKEGIVVEGWPLQFLPVADDLEAEALSQAQDVGIDADEGRVSTQCSSRSIWWHWLSASGARRTI